jgi:hypothetical protein
MHKEEISSKGQIIAPFESYWNVISIKIFIYIFCQASDILPKNVSKITVPFESYSNIRNPDEKNPRVLVDF